MKVPSQDGQISLKQAKPTSNEEAPSKKNDGTTVDANAHFIRKVKDAVRQASKHNNGEAVPWEGEYPIIDVSPWLTSTVTDADARARDQVVQQVAREAVTSGSFHITGHGVPESVLERLEATSRDFFARQLAEKRQYYNPAHRRGYTGLQSESAANVYGHETKPTEKADLRECYSMEYPASSSVNAQAPEAFQEALEQYMEHMTQLDTALHRILAAALRLVKQVQVSDDFLEAVKGGALLRCTYFPEMGEEFGDATRLAAHSDWGTATIVNSRYPGLEEIRGGRWIHVPVLRPGGLHVIVGEMSSIWSNGTFAANVHRVGHGFDGDRTSFVYFCGQGVNSGSTDDHTAGVEPVHRDGEDVLFGKVSIGQHVKSYTGRYLS